MTSGMITVSGIQNFLGTNRSPPLRTIRSSAASMIFAHSSTAFLKSTCSFRPNKPQKWALKLLQITARIPITDHVMDFGRYKGKMVGTVPSKYLKWVSENVRTGLYSHWADIAEQVLEDPVYQDRIEWEYAQRVLEGDNIRSRSDGSDAVSQLLEIGERFGWDNDDKVGWSKVRYHLIGTSLSGRIPRKVSSSSSPTGAGDALKVDKQRLGASKEKKIDEILSESEQRRRERRERAKLKKAPVDWRRERLGISGSRGSSVNVNTDGDDSTLTKNQGSDQEEETQKVNRPFPGREALWKKAISSRRRSL